MPGARWAFTWWSSAYLFLSMPPVLFLGEILHPVSELHLNPIIWRMTFKRNSPALCVLKKAVCKDHFLLRDLFICLCIYLGGGHETGFLYVPWLSWNSCCRSGRPGTQKSSCFCLCLWRWLPIGFRFDFRMPLILVTARSGIYFLNTQSLSHKWFAVLLVITMW